MSYKIIRVLNGIVSIASSDGTFFNVSIEELNFNPKAGDEVQCFRNGENVIVFKNSLIPHSTNTVSEIETQGIDRNTPVENPFADNVVEKKSSVPWFIGIILLLLGVLFACIYLKNSNVGTMTDSRDGKKYKTVKIGSQIWMAENLNYKTKKGSWCYRNKESNCDKYGRLYMWKAAMSACPSGWRLPTDADIETLFANVRGIETAGKMLKSRTGWEDYEGKSGNGIDKYGFNVLPAGIRNNVGNFSGAGEGANFWGATEYGENDAYFLFLYYGNESALLHYINKDLAFSVRCLRGSN